MVAINEIAGTITSSPGPMPAYLQAISKPAVQLVRKRLFSMPRYSSTAASAASTLPSYHPYVNPGSQRGGGKRLIYSLSAVIHHLGSGLGGHYICFRRVKDTTGDRWFLMNDSHVKEVPWSTVHQNNIYMVEYELEERNCSCFFVNKHCHTP